jgi:hypothetical protein
MGQGTQMLPISSWSTRDRDVSYFQLVKGQRYCPIRAGQWIQMLPTSSLSRDRCCPLSAGWEAQMLHIPSWSRGIDVVHFQLVERHIVSYVELTFFFWGRETLITINWILYTGSIYFFVNLQIYFSLKMIVMFYFISVKTTVNIIFWC